MGSVMTKSESLNRKMLSPGVGARQRQMRAGENPGAFIGDLVANECLCGTEIQTLLSIRFDRTICDAC
jgi:hypothetical protein